MGGHSSTLTYLFILSLMEPLERACAQFALHPFSTSYRCKMLPCGPLQKPGGAEKSAFVPTLIRILKQAGKQMQVWRSGGKWLPTLVPHLGPHPAVWSDGMLGGSSGKTGMKKRKTCRAYVLLRMGNNINSWQPLPSPKPALERVQTGIHAPPSPPAPQPSHQWGADKEGRQRSG